MGDDDSLISDQDRRAFLLGTADLKTTHRIELELLRGGEELDRIERLEDELIDDFVFGRLPDNENLRFWDHFLCTATRKSKLNVANELHLWAHSGVDDAGQDPQSHSPISQSAWTLAAGIAACALVVLSMWLGVSNARLRLQLAAVRQGDRTTVRGTVPQKSAPPAGHGVDGGEAGRLGALVAEATLAPGLTRAIQASQVVKIPSGAQVVLLTLESLDMGHPSGLRYQLFNPDGRCIWTEEITNSTQFQSGKPRVLAIPAAILGAGDYQLRVAAKNAGGKLADLDSYSFRVLKD